jgi:MYXO-CTERM domain-containing protein
MKRSLVLAAAWLTLTPRSAGATCEPEACDVSDRWQSFQLTSEVVATDGVLVLDAERGALAEMTDAEALEYLTASVTADGQPITGQLEVDGWGGVVWRPDAPLPAGASLSLSLTVDNEALSPNDVCSAEWVELGPFVAQVSMGPAPALEPMAVASMVASSHAVYETRRLDTLVCCDGAYPMSDNVSCGPSAEWQEGYCASTEAHGLLSTGWQVELDALPPELAGNLAMRVSTSVGTYITRPIRSHIDIESDAPFCGHLELLQRGTGEIVALEEHCFGDDVADRLGDFAIDPDENLAAMCTDQPYVCEIQGGHWDPEACEPHEIVLSKKGCSTTDRPGAPLLFGLLALLGLLRRRR